MASTFDGGCAAQCTPARTITANTKTTTPATTYAHRRSASSMMSAFAALESSANGASRQEDEHEEREPHGHEEADGQRSECNRATRARRDDFLDLGIAAVQANVLEM